MFVHVAHINPRARNLFLDTCQLWLTPNKIRMLFLSFQLFGSGSDLNKSSTGTEGASSLLLIAIVSPWKVFFSRTGVFCFQPTGRTCGWVPWQLGKREGLLEKMTVKCAINTKQTLKTNGKKKKLEERLWKRLASVSSLLSWWRFIKCIFSATLGSEHTKCSSTWKEKKTSENSRRTKRKKNRRKQM